MLAEIIAELYFSSCCKPTCVQKTTFRNNSLKFAKCFVTAAAWMWACVHITFWFFKFSHLN